MTSKKKQISSQEPAKDENKAVRYSYPSMDSSSPQIFKNILFIYKTVTCTSDVFV